MNLKELGLEAGKIGNGEILILQPQRYWRSDDIDILVNYLEDFLLEYNIECLVIPKDIHFELGCEFFSKINDESLKKLGLQKIRN